MVTIVNNDALYSWKLLRVGFMVLPQKKKSCIVMHRLINSTESFHNIYIFQNLLHITNRNNSY
jgi:hypothetical protein